MAITRKKKEELVAQYVESFSRSRALFFTDYRGLSVSGMEELRSKIREADGSYAVVKNTLALRALEEAGLPIPESLMAGPVAISFAYGDVPPLAKVLTDFSKQTEILNVTGGILDGAVLDAAAVKAVADLPPRDVVMAQLLGLMQQPGNLLAGVLSAAGNKLAGTIKAYADKLETSESAA